MDGKQERSQADWEIIHDWFSRLRDMGEARRNELLGRAPCDGYREEIRELLEAHDRALKVAPRAGAPAPSIRLPAIPAGFEAVGVAMRGGMGVIVEALQLQPRRRVALKFLGASFSSEAMRWRFELEIELLARLRHPSIACLYEAGVSDSDEPWFAMEYVPGARDILTYADELELSLTERLRLFLPFCFAVHHAHLRGVLHRDLKPSNLLVDEEGRCVVIDFGVGRLLDRTGRELTRDGELLGTVRYMSPEQLEGAHPDPSSDVFALGVVLFELLTAQWPFEASTDSPFGMADALRSVPARRVTRIRSDCPADLEAVVARALEKDPQRRYSSVEALADDLQCVLEHRPVRARPATWGYQLRKALRRHRSIAIASGLILISLVAGLAMAVNGMRRAQLAESATQFALEQARSEKQNALAAAAVADIERVEASAARDQAQMVLDFLCRGLGAANPRNMGIDVSVREFVDQVSARAEVTFGRQPLVAARLLEATGRVFLSMGQVSKGLIDLERCLELRVSILEAGDPVLLRTMGFVADANMLGGRFGKAQELAQAAVRDFKASRSGDGTQAALYADLLTSLGMAAAQNKAFDIARAALEEALALKQADPVADLLPLLNTKVALGLTLNGLGQTVLARRMYEEVLGAQREHYPGGHVEMVSPLTLLSQLELADGEVDRGVALAREVCALTLTHYGDSHAQYASSLQALGVALIDLEACEEAEAVLLQAAGLDVGDSVRDGWEPRELQAVLARAFECQGDDPDSARVRAADAMR